VFFFTVLPFAFLLNFTDYATQISNERRSSDEKHGGRAGKAG